MLNVEDVRDVSQPVTRSEVARVAGFLAGIKTHEPHPHPLPRVGCTRATMRTSDVKTSISSTVNMMQTTNARMNTYATFPYIRSLALRLVPPR